MTPKIIADHDPSTDLVTAQSRDSAPRKLQGDNRVKPGRIAHSLGSQIPCLGILPAVFIRTLGLLMLFAGSLLLTGCGSEKPKTAKNATAQPADQEEIDDAGPKPTEIVSQFLDRVRRGGNGSTANELLTKLAQQEMTRIGRPLQLPGSPDTTFEVGKAFPVPGEQDAMWVHTVLSEPTAEGQPLKYEVVWTLRNELHRWRISGFVIDQGEQFEPLQIDFENGDEMAARLAAMEDSGAEAEKR